MTPVRPKFTDPPLIERAISVVFEPLSDFSIGDYGLFWADIRSEFPTCEAMEPISFEREEFDGFRPKSSGIQVVSAKMPPRVAFRNSATGELVQVQNDRFGFNWIKTGDDHKYPHSEATLDRFFELLNRFIKYCDGRGLGPMQIIQCELTNVNIVLVSDVGETFADMATVFKLAPLEYKCDDILLEHQLVGSKHLILDDEKKPIGRVHTLGQPSLKVPTNEEAYRLDILARGAPFESSIDGARRFFDAAVSAVNAVFLASTTVAGRRFWGELNG